MHSTSLLPEARRGPQEVTDFASNNTLVFDPETEVCIASIPGSGPNANVRQILRRGNEVCLHESGTDRLMLVTLGR